MNFNLLDEIVPVTEGEAFAQNDNKQVDEQELQEFTLEAEQFAELHTKLEKTSDIIDRALDTNLDDDAMELLSESLSIGLGVTLEAEDAPKTSEKIKESFKKFVAQFVAFVRKVWTKFMASFGASADDLRGLIKGVEEKGGEVSLDKLPFLSILEVVGENKMGSNLDTVDKKLTTLYKERSIKKSVGEYYTNNFSDVVTGLPKAKYITSGSIPRTTSTQRAFVIPKSGSAVTAFVVDSKSEGGGAMIDIKTVSLNVDAVKQDASKVIVKADEIVKHLGKCVPKENLKEYVDTYYGYASDIVKGDVDIETKKFYSATVKIAFTVVNSAMAYNKGVSSDAKKFLKA